MILVFVVLASALKPIVLFAGVYGSNLYATHREFSKLWYCPSSMDHSLLWVDAKFLMPPLHNCIIELLKCHYDPETGKVGSMPGLHIDVGDFGGSQGLRHVDKGIGDFHLIESLDTMIEYFKSRGYTLRKDLFGVPYDWRLTIVGLDSLWPRLTKLIERAFARNGNQKVTLFGYSNGAMVVQHFLNEKCSREWKNKFIEKVIYLAPGYAGAGSAVVAAWNRVFPILPFVTTEELEDSIETMPVIHAQFPNFEVFKDLPVVSGPDGKDYYPNEFLELLLRHNKLRNESYKIAQLSLDVLQNPPQDHGMPTYILYNSGIETVYGLKFNASWSERPSVVEIPGDATISAKAVEWPCNFWNRTEGAPLICMDFNMSTSPFSHQRLSTNRGVIETIFNLTNIDPWYEREN